MSKKLLFRLAVLVTAMMCSLGVCAQEAYACYTPENTTLTFYYDTERSSHAGTTYDMNEDPYSPRWYADGVYSSVTTVVFDPSFADARPTTTYSWFYGMENLETITGMNYLNTSEVIIMSSMFMNCKKLTSLDLSSFNTANVTDMSYLFSYSYSLTSIDLSSFNTANVTDMSNMFRGCSSLQTVYAGDGWSTAAVTSSSNMFRNCYALVGGKGTTYSYSNPEDATYAHLDGGPSNPGYFTAKNTGPEAYACYTLDNTTLTFYCDTLRSSCTGTTYDLNKGFNSPGWYTDGTYANVTQVVFDPSFADARPLSTYFWFNNMTNLETITGMDYLNTSEVTIMGDMFNGCSSLTSLDLTHFNTEGVIRMNDMFNECTGLTSLDLSSFNTANVINMDRMFCKATNLTRIVVSNEWSTAAVTNSIAMFHLCNSLVGGQGTTYSSSNPSDTTYAHIDGGPSNPGYFTDIDAITVTEAYACYTPENTTLTFYYDKKRRWRTGTTYDLNEANNEPGWCSDGTNTNVTTVVFDPSFADARPTNTNNWFYFMTNLQSITGISYLNTSEVTAMGWMFAYCQNLTSLDLSGFNTAKVTNMGGMFFSCTGLTSLDVSNFNTAKVSLMNNMFFMCSGLTSLDLSSFNTANVANMSTMFAGCENQATIYVGNEWSTAALYMSSNMFINCTNLVGGMGTTYDENHVNGDYAHIDGGPSNPGYFTDKNASQRGDVNGDGSVTISDVTALIDLLLGGDTIINPAADCNGDTNVTISDVTALIDYLLGGSWN